MVDEHDDLERLLKGNDQLWSTPGHPSLVLKIDGPLYVPLFSLRKLRLDVTFLECFPGDKNLYIDFSVIFDLNIHFPGFRMEEIKFMPCFSPGVYFRVLVLKL